VGNHRQAALLGALILAVAACGSAPVPAEDAARSDALARQIHAAADGDVIDLRDSLGSDWDRLSIFGAYASNSSAREALGFDLDIEAISPWATTEGGTVFVLARGDHVVAWVSLRSGEGTADCLFEGIPARDDMLLAAEARAIVRVGSDGLRTLASPARPNCWHLNPSPSTPPGPTASLAADPPFARAAAVAAAKPQADAVSDGAPTFVSAATYDMADYCDGNRWCASYTGPVWVVVFTFRTMTARATACLLSSTGRLDTSSTRPGTDRRHRHYEPIVRDRPVR
jgi:hypothetical protein